MRKINVLIIAVLLSSAAFSQTQVPPNDPSSPIYHKDGDVGIGTNNPSNNQGWNTVLDVYGENHSKILATSLNANYKVGLFSHSTMYGGGGFVGTESNHPFFFLANYLPKMTIFTNGNIGIGTIAPSYKLEVNGNIFGNQFISEAVTIANGNTWDTNIHTHLLDRAFVHTDGSRKGFFFSAYGNDADIRFQTGNSWSNKPDKSLVLANSGNVGIGTTNPVNKLHILHGGQTDGVKIETTGSNDNTAKLQVLYNYDSSSASRNAAIELGRDADDSGSYKWRLLANSGYTWGNKPTFSIQNLISGVYNTRLKIANDGNVGIGISNPTHKLTVDGVISAKEVKVSTTPNSDYVFEPDYKLRPIDEVDQFVKENKHLPDIPSAEEFKENGVGLGEMDNMLLRKVEELTLYVIDQQKELVGLKKENEELKAKDKELDELRALIKELVDGK